MKRTIFILIALAFLIISALSCKEPQQIEPPKEPTVMLDSSLLISIYYNGWLRGRNSGLLHPDDLQNVWPQDSLYILNVVFYKIK